MIDSILVLCMGNICRSPVGERMLRQLLPGIKVASAGFIAQEGGSADPQMCERVEKEGICLDDHRSRRFTSSLGKEYDLLLIMERNHLRIIHQYFPQLSGKSRLFSCWNGNKDIPDPFNKSKEMYDAVYQQLTVVALHWKKRLIQKSEWIE